eukprot:1785753-Amphidinium_carterae.1
MSEWLLLACIFGGIMQSQAHGFELAFIPSQPSKWLPSSYTEKGKGAWSSTTLAKHLIKSIGKRKSSPLWVTNTVEFAKVNKHCKVCKDHIGRLMRCYHCHLYVHGKLFATPSNCFFTTKTDEVLRNLYGCEIPSDTHIRSVKDAQDTIDAVERRMEVR